MTTCKEPRLTQSLDYIETIRANLETAKKVGHESKMYIRSFAHPQKAFVVVDSKFKRIVYIVQQWFARKEKFFVGEKAYRVRCFDHDANVRVLRKLFDNALSEVVCGCEGTVEKAQRVVDFVLRLDNMTEYQGSRKTAHEMLVEKIKGASSLEELERIFSSLAICCDDEKRFFSKIIFEKARSSHFSELDRLYVHLQPFLPAPIPDPIIELPVATTDTNVVQEVVVEVPYVVPEPPQNVALDGGVERAVKPAVTSQGTNTDPVCVENKTSSISPRSVSVLSGNTVNITIGGSVSRCCQSILTAGVVALVANTCGLPTGIPSVVASLLSPYLLLGGKALLSRVWTPVHVCIDTQCNKLPQCLRIPMKVVWRVTLAAGAAFCVYKTATGWVAAVDATPQQSVVREAVKESSAPKVVIPIMTPASEGWMEGGSRLTVVHGAVNESSVFKDVMPTMTPAPEGWMGWGNRLWREGFAAFHLGKKNPIGEAFSGKVAYTGAVASTGGLLLQEATGAFPGGTVQTEVVRQIVSSKV